MSELALVPVQHRTHRLIASRHPMVGVFDDLTADKDDLRIAFLLESATNDRLIVAAERLQLLPDAQVITGEGASIVMASFLHADDQGGRFTDPRLGAWYAAFELATAIAETLYHNDRRLRFSAEPFPSRIQIRELIADLDTQLIDIRGRQTERPELYDPDPANYRPAQTFGVGLRWPDGDPTRAHEGAPGLIYDSVRKAGGTNVCIYWPGLVPLPVQQGDHFEYRWSANGEAEAVRITNVKF
ncbi:MAG: RES family NAD+ phosphorylase [Hyphomicrobiales bacterium]|nr:RES family NAD+ phosphorylase [Hyphomicrobiales bacterium]